MQGERGLLTDPNLQVKVNNGLLVETTMVTKAKQRRNRSQNPGLSQSTQGILRWTNNAFALKVCTECVATYDARWLTTTTLTILLHAHK